MRKIAWFAIMLALAAPFCARLSAQSEAATLRGTVRDASQAAVGGASIVLTNLDQGRSWRAASNVSGAYDIEQIPPGRYSLAIEAPGFKRYEQPNLTLQVNQVAEIDPELQLGSVSETVEVKAEAPLLDAASSSLGEVVNHLTMVALPLNGRDVMQLVALTPGITTTPTYQNGNSNPSGDIGGVGFSANGGRNVSTQVLLDGSPQEVMGYNQPAYVPPPDAVEEFKVMTNSLSAEYGRTGGAVVSMVHKSGSKDFHGDLFEFLRNDVFDANNFFSNRSGKDRAPFRFNQFGGTFGGPLTKSRESTFFFFSYQGVRQVSPGSTFYTVPTAAMKQGDFSGSGTNIYDPSTIDAQGLRQQFPGNRIPLSRLNPVSLKLLAFYPDPTRAGLSNNFFSQAGSRSGSNDYSARVDRRISDRQNLFGRFSFNDLDTTTPNNFHNAGSPDAGVNGNRSRSGTLDDTYLWSGWVLHGNFGYAYNANPRDSSSEGFDVTSLGLPAALAANSQFAIFPLIQPQGFAALGPNATWIIGNRFDTTTWTGDVSHLFGSHTLKAGGVYRLNRVSSFRPSSPAGNFSFDKSWTTQTFNGNTGGNAIASMLLGNMSSGVIQYQPSLAIQVPYAGGYLQDDWRVNSRLTLNLGLRWDSDRPMTERYNRLSFFNFNAALPIQAPGLPPLRGGLQFVGRDGEPRGVKNPDNNNFAPRLGLAYKVGDRLVVRSGFGLFYNPTTGVGPGGSSVGALTFDAVTNVTTSIDGGRTPYTSISNPFPDGYNRPTNGSLGLLSLLGQGVNAQFRNDRSPYSAQWNFDLQYQLGKDSLLDVAYAGNAGVKLLAQAETNQLPDADLALGSALTQKTANPFAGLIPATTSLGQPTTTVGQLLRPYPQFLAVTQTWGSLAHSSYHSLQVKYHKRYGNGLQFLVAYTWSKLIDDYSSVAGFLGQQNPGFTDNNNRRLDRSLSALDQSHRLVANYQYELPFGKGRKFLNHGLAANALGGWDVNGITTVQSGLPISITSAVNTTNSLGGAQRPNSTGISTRSAGGIEDRIDGYFNPAAFANAPLYTFGNVGRLIADNRGPHLIDTDLSLLKQIHITESKRFELRGEFFNLFNHVNFANPSQTVYGLPGFGAITSATPHRIIQVGLKFLF